MPKVFKARVSQTTTSTGTGDVALSLNAASGRRTIQATVPVGSRVSYLIEGDSGQWEIGTGTYIGSNTLQRTEPEDGSEALPVNLAAGTKRVLITPTPADLAAATSPVGISVPALQGITVLPSATFDAGSGSVLAQLGVTIGTDDAVVAGLRLKAGAGSEVRVSPIDGSSGDGYTLVIQASSPITDVWVGEVGQASYTEGSGNVIARGQMLRLQFSSADDVRMVVLDLFPSTGSGRYRQVNVMGKAGSMAPDPAGVVAPASASLPSNPTLWLPMHDLAGSALASGFSTTSDYVRPLAATLSGTNAQRWNTYGVLTMPASNTDFFASMVPGAGSADMQWLEGIFRLDNLAGQQLLFGFAITCDLTANGVIFSWGRGEAGSSGWAIGVDNTSEYLNLQSWGAGATGFTTRTLTGIDLSSLPPNETVRVVVDMRGKSGGMVDLTGYTSFNGGAVASTTITDIDMRGTGGTAAPGISSYGLNFFRRQNTSGASRYLSENTRIAELWAQRRATPSNTAAISALQDMIAYAGEFPRRLRG